MILAIKLLNLHSEDWIGIVFTIVLFIIAIANYMFEHRVRKTFALPFSKSYFSLYIKDNPLVVSAFNSIFFFVNILTYALLIYFVIREFNIDVGGDDKLFLFLKISVFILVYFILKYLLNIVFNKLILNVKDVNIFTFYKVSFRNFTSLILIGLLIIHQYSPMNTRFGIYALGVVFASTFAFGYVFSARNFLNKNSNSLLHIILYLCALEIAPFLIYGKYVITNLL